MQSKKELLENFEYVDDYARDESDLHGCCAITVKHDFFNNDDLIYEIDEKFKDHCNDYDSFEKVSLNKKEIDDIIFKDIYNNIDRQEDNYIVTLLKDKQSLTLKAFRKISKLPENKGKFKFIDFVSQSTGSQLVMIIKTVNKVIKNGKGK